VNLSDNKKIRWREARAASQRQLSFLLIQYDITSNHTWLYIHILIFPYFPFPHLLPSRFISSFSFPHFPAAQFSPAFPFYSCFIVLTRNSIIVGFTLKAFMWRWYRPTKQCLPRYAMHKGGLCHHAVSVCVSVCLFVTLSVTFVDSVKTSSHTILVFPHQTSWQYSDGKSLTGAWNAGGVGRNRDSEPISGSIACCERFQLQMQCI